MLKRFSLPSPQSKQVPESVPMHTLQEENVEHRALMNDIVAGNVEKIYAYEGDWNFTMKVKGRASATTPLCCLCRPELVDGLKGVTPLQQRDLILFAILNRKADILFPPDRELQAITDVVYEGRVDLLKEIMAVSDVLTEDKVRNFLYRKSNFLHMAVHDGRVEMTEFLIDLGLDVNQKNSAGQTPLFWCFCRGVVSEACARLLVAQNADAFEIYPAAGASPFSLAIQNAPKFAEELLLERGKVLSNRLGFEQRKFNFHGIVIATPSDEDPDPPDTRTSSDDGPDTDLVDELAFSEQVPNPRKGWDTFSTTRIEGVLQNTRDQQATSLKAWRVQNDPTGCFADIDNLEDFRTRLNSANELPASLRKLARKQQDELENIAREVDEAFKPAHPMSAIALMVKYGRRELLMTPIIWEVLSLKWGGFRCKDGSLDHSVSFTGLKHTYYRHFAVYATFMFSVFLMTSLWPTRATDEEWKAQTFARPRPVIYIAAVVSFIAMMIIQRGEWVECSRLKFRNYIRDWQNVVDCTIWITYLVFLVSIVERMASFNQDPFRSHITITGAILQVLFGLKMLEFASIPRQTGPLVASTMRMLVDFRDFFALFAIFYITFGFALWPAFRSSGEITFSSLWIKILLWTLGDWDYSDFETIDSRSTRLVAQGLFLIYILLCSVLLLNMVIAMMSQTYEQVEDDAEGEWLLNRARTMLTLELNRSATSNSQLMRHLCATNNKVIERTAFKTRDTPTMEVVQNDLETLGKQLAIVDREIGQVKALLEKQVESRGSRKASMWQRAHPNRESKPIEVSREKDADDVDSEEEEAADDLRRTLL